MESSFIGNTKSKDYPHRKVTTNTKKFDLTLSPLPLTFTKFKFSTFKFTNLTFKFLETDVAIFADCVIWHGWHLANSTTIHGVGQRHKSLLLILLGLMEKNRQNAYLGLCTFIFFRIKSLYFYLFRLSPCTFILVHIESLC